MSLSQQEVKEIEAIFRVVVGEVVPVNEIRVVAAQQKEILEKLGKHNDTLYGNGKEGLTTTVSRLDHWAKSVQDTLQDILKWALIAGVGGGITLLLALGARAGLFK